MFPLFKNSSVSNLNFSKKKILNSFKKLDNIHINFELEISSFLEEFLKILSSEDFNLIKENYTKNFSEEGELLFEEIFNHINYNSRKLEVIFTRQYKIRLKNNIRPESYSNNIIIPIRYILEISEEKTKAILVKKLNKEILKQYEKYSQAFIHYFFCLINSIKEKINELNHLNKEGNKLELRRHIVFLEFLEKKKLDYNDISKFNFDFIMGEINFYQNLKQFNFEELDLFISNISESYNNSKDKITFDLIEEYENEIRNYDFSTIEKKINIIIERLKKIYSFYKNIKSN